MKQCERCEKEIWVTNHFCLRCLRDLSRRKLDNLNDIAQLAEQKEDINDKMKKEFAGLTAIPSEFLKKDYLEMLKTHTVLFSEMNLSWTRFRRVMRLVKYDNYEVHCLMFKTPGGRPEAIMFEKSMANEAFVKIRNIYPNIKIPRQFLRLAQ